MSTLSVIIPTYNPRLESLVRVLAALQAQTLPLPKWELIIVDNASTRFPAIDLSWHPRARCIREPQLGLTQARRCGTAAATGDILVWVDDDNVLQPDYLANALDFMVSHPEVGAAGGATLGEYVDDIPPWFVEGMAPLGCRDLGDSLQVMIWNHTYPTAAPIGAGLVIRSKWMQEWIALVNTDPLRQALGRRGNALTSGEDNDICLTILRLGQQLAYSPDLRLTHVIGPGRLSAPYLERISRVSFRDFIRVLDLHGLRPWSPIAPWTVWLRAIKAYVQLKAWTGPAARIRWQSAVGCFEGRALLKQERLS